MANPMNGGDGTIEAAASWHAGLEKRRIAEVERVARVNDDSRANRDGFHSGDDETELLADLAARGIHVHSDLGRSLIAAFRASKA